jgi:sporulation protein YlmC with PRC-barrel domain
MRVMAGVTAGGLLGVPVRLHGIQLGHVADVVLDVERRRALGLEVVCGDDERRFLPLSVASIDEHEVRMSSPLVLLNASELGFYTTRGSTFRAIRGTTVVRGRATVGRLEDIVLADGGPVAGLIVDGDEVPYGDDVRLGAPGTDVRRAS